MLACSHLLLKISSVSGASLASDAALEPWNTIENWCDLCKEPVNSWLGHVGKREHVAMELFFNELQKIENGSRTPQLVWMDFVEKFPGVQFQSIFSHMDRIDSERRSQIIPFLRYLERQKVLFLGKNYFSSPLGKKHGGYYDVIHGGLATFRHFYVSFFTMFNELDEKQLSTLNQSAGSSFNFETVFELCNLSSLQEYAYRSKTGNVSDLSFTQKAEILRGIIGQLIWALDVDLVPCPYETRPPPHVEETAAITVKALLVELVLCRCSEYVTRVEPVWREKGAKRTGGFALPTPRLPNAGIRDALYNQLTHEAVEVDEHLSGVKFVDSEEILSESLKTQINLLKKHATLMQLVKQQLPEKDVRRMQMQNCGCGAFLLKQND